MTGSRTVVVGFDALSFEYLDAFSLPNFDALRSDGVEAPLDSTFPPWTASAWPSMYTGADPSHHGVYDFFGFSGGYPDQAEIVDSTDVELPALWRYLSERDVPSVVLNMPVTHPVEEIDGAIVPGYLAPEEAPAHPEPIRDELDDAVGGYRIYADGEMADGSDRKLDSYLDLINRRKRASTYLLETYDWELAVIQVQKTDAVFHNFSSTDAFRQVYAAADDLLGAILSTVGDDVNVVVCSDHGIGPTTGYKVYVNEVLREHGLLQTRSDGTLPTLAEEKSELVGGAETDSSDDSPDSSLSARAVAAVETVLSRTGVSPGDIYAAASRVGADSLIASALPDDAIDGVGEQVDWRASRAYCRSGNELGVRINVAGRDPDGVVPPESYETVRDELIDLFRELRTPDGDPVFEFVNRREAVYDGPAAHQACDVVFMPTEMNHVVATSLLGRRFVPVDKYDHKQRGVFLGAGPDFDPDASVEDLSLPDVAPVTMSLLGAPIPERMTGSVPDGLVDSPTDSERYDLSASSATDSTAQRAGDDVEARLEDLGYL